MVSFISGLIWEEAVMFALMPHLSHFATADGCHRNLLLLQIDDINISRISVHSDSEILYVYFQKFRQEMKIKLEMTSENARQKMNYFI